MRLPDALFLPTHRALAPSFQGFPLADSLFYSRQHFLKAVNPKTEEGFSGIHADHVAAWFDEATAILTSRFSLIDTQATKIVCTFNPRVVSGPCRNAFPKGPNQDVSQVILRKNGKNRLITIDGQDIINVKYRCLDKPIAPNTGIKIGTRFYSHGETIPPDDFAKIRRIIPGQTCLDQWLVLKSNPDPNFVNCFAHGHPRG